MASRRITQIHSVPLKARKVQGGIESWIRDFLEMSESDYRVLGSGKVGECLASGSRRVESIPVYSGSCNRWLPEGAQLAMGVLRFRRLLTEHIFVHRIELVLLLKVLRPQSQLVLFVHTNLAAQAEFDSGKRWQLRGAWYKVYERLALRLCSLAVVHSVQDFTRVSVLAKKAILAQAWANDRIFAGPGGTRQKRSGIAWVGRMEAVKDPLLALEVFRQTANAHDQVLYMVGDGSLRHLVQRKAMVCGLADRVFLLDPMEPERLAQLLLGVKVLLHTSVFEGAPRILVEAAMQGAKVVTSRAGDPEGVALLTGGVLAEDRSRSAFVRALLSSIRSECHEVSASFLERVSGSKYVPELEKSIIECLSSD